MCRGAYAFCSAGQTSAKSAVLSLIFICGGMSLGLIVHESRPALPYAHAALSPKNDVTQMYIILGNAAGTTNGAAVMGAMIVGCFAS